MLNKIFYFLCCISCLQATSLRLENDSSFPLKAVIQAASGSVIGEVSLDPGEMKNWNDTSAVGTRNKTSNKSITPLMVHWYCKSGDTFSFSDKVSTGSLVRARDGSGNKNCMPPKKDKQEGE